MKGVKQLKRLTIFLLCFALVLPMVLGGCSDAQDTETSADRAYKTPESLHETASKQVAANDRFKLFWDNEQKCLMLSDVQSQKIWSTIPYDFYLLPDTDGIAKVRMKSPIYLEYFDDSIHAIKTSYGYVDALLNGMVEAGRTSSGFKVTYFFNDLEISVPVLYVLQESGLEIRLLIDEIREGSKKVYSVSLAPFLASAKAGTDSYLFVPSGSGALMSTEESSRGVRTFSGSVYGSDLAITKTEELVNEVPVRLPVFGVREGDSALCGVIGKGAEMARIEAQAGNAEVGYSSVYTTFELRSRNKITVKGNNNMISVSTRLSSAMVDTDYASVTYYPLNGDQANYASMAQLYREQLFPNEASAKPNETALYLQFLGGTMIQRNMLGIPYETLGVATTFVQVQAILHELSEMTQTVPVAELTGFGKTGLDIGQIAGGFGFGSAFGNADDLAALRAYCEEKTVTLFTDFDVLNFNKSGKGVSTFSDCVKTINRTRAAQLMFLNTIYTADNRHSSWFLLQLNKLPGVADKLETLLDKHQLDGVSLRSLSSSIYSDNGDAKHYAKNGFSVAATAVLQGLKKSGRKISSADANAYAAVLSDYIFSSPTTSAKADGFDEEVPFYQMVFKGQVPIAVSPLNTAADTRMQFLKAMESGSALSFSVCYSWDAAFSNSANDSLRYSVYAGWKDEIISLTKEAKPLLKAVYGATVSGHEILSNGLRRTTFSNGVQVYVNYTDEAVTTPAGTVPAKDFIFKGGEG